MLTILAIVFVIGYLGIILEHSISVNKASLALITGTICWTVVALMFSDKEKMNEELMHHIGEIAGIVFFLMGAMTIVELVDTYHGFDIITEQITTRDKRKLLWIIAFITFFLSAVLDNLTATIVMITLLKKLIEERKVRLLYVGLVIIAANAGGAWSPMGDVTTTMLWIGGQLSSFSIIKKLFLPSLVCLIIPTLVMTFQLKGQIFAAVEKKNKSKTSDFEKKLILSFGLGGLLFVPLFKYITHLPPFVGMLLVLGILWLITELLLKNKEEEHKTKYSILNALTKMDLPSLLFFLGILMAVSSLQTAGVLEDIAQWLSATIKNQTILVTFIGLLSSVIDNVPLVAAAMGMYSLDIFPLDHTFWNLLAYCAGTGGSALIIGSAAGVAAMGIEKIDFFWYIKNISFLAILGYLGGIFIYILQMMILQ